MAYYLAARLGENAELLVFNNLKVEHRGFVAQIDHLVLSRWTAYFVETKSVSDTISINAEGQWARVYGRKYANMESPLEQSRRHETILFDLLTACLPEFMSKWLGMQMTFRKLLEVRHLVAVSVGATIQGRGKRAVMDHLRPLDQIPQTIWEHHASVRSGTLMSVLAEMRNPETKRRSPAFSDHELDACRRILIQRDVAPTPLEQVHSFIETLPAQAALLKEDQPDHKPETTKKAQAAAAPPLVAAEPVLKCPKCNGPMVLRTASRGDRAGSKFYGCQQYPKCRGIVNMQWLQRNA